MNNNELFIGACVRNDHERAALLFLEEAFAAEDDAFSKTQELAYIDYWCDYDTDPLGLVIVERTQDWLRAYYPDSLGFMAPGKQLPFAQAIIARFREIWPARASAPCDDSTSPVN
ncbi:MAG: hypothetical protein AAF430_22035 [Myxococcota bacterium]